MCSRLSGHRTNAQHQLLASGQCVDRVNAHPAVTHRELSPLHRVGIDPRGEQTHNTHVLSIGGAPITNADLVDRRFANRHRTFRIAHRQLQIRDGNDVCFNFLGTLEITTHCLRGHFKAVCSWTVDLAAKLHKLGLSRRNSFGNLPTDHAILCIQLVTFAGRDQLHTFRKFDSHRNRLGACGAGVTHPEIVRGFGPRVLFLGTAPIEFQFWLAAQHLANRFGVQPPRSRGRGLHHQVARFTSGQFQFDFLAGPRFQNSDRVRAGRFFVTAWWNKLDYDVLRNTSARITQRKLKSLCLVEQDLLGS